MNIVVYYEELHIMPKNSSIRNIQLSYFSISQYQCERVNGTINGPTYIFLDHFTRRKFTATETIKFHFTR